MHTLLDVFQEIKSNVVIPKSIRKRLLNNLT